MSGVSKVERHTKKLRRFGFLKIEQQKQGEFNKYEMPHLIPTLEPSSTNRLSTFMKEYLEYSRGVHSQNTTRTYAGCMRELISYVGDVPLASIDVRMMEQFLAHKKLFVSAHTSRRHYISLKSIFERAVVWELIDSNPLKKIKQPKVPEVEVAYFNQNELHRLLSVIDDEDLRDLVLFTFYTSFRRAEVLAVRWKDVDLNVRMIHLRNSEIFTTKSGRNRSVGICQGLYAILTRRKEGIIDENELVFKDSFGRALKGESVTKKFKSFVLKAGLDRRLRYHSLRHSSASLLLAMGAPSFAVQKHLGHFSLKTTEKYSHVPSSLLIQIADVLPIISDCEK